MESEGNQRRCSGAVARFAVPDDFPRPEMEGDELDQRVRAGLVEFDGVYYVAGCSPPELWVRMTECEELVEMYCWQCKAAKQDHSGLSDADIISRGLVLAAPMQWCSPEELKWVFKRIAQSLGWALPEELQ